VTIGDGCIIAAAPAIDASAGAPAANAANPNHGRDHHVRGEALALHVDTGHAVALCQQRRSGAGAHRRPARLEEAPRGLGVKRVERYTRQADCRIPAGPVEHPRQHADKRLGRGDLGRLVEGRDDKRLPQQLGDAAGLPHPA
jgi:hypothetical protein